MCLILFAWKMNPRYPFILAANRDEFLQRPTAASHWWEDKPGLLAGKDLQAGGTWMGITRSGRFSALTNVRDNRQQRESFRSRGELPLSYLGTSLTNADYSAQLQTNEQHYRGYNLLFGSFDQLYFSSNRDAPTRQIEAGVHGLSNATLNSPWPKVTHGKKHLEQLASAELIDPDDLFKLLGNKTIAGDDELPETGVGLELERMLSPICISSPEYGTRTSSVLLLDSDGNISLYEKDRAPKESPIRSFHFSIS